MPLLLKSQLYRQRSSERTENRCQPHSDRDLSLVAHHSQVMHVPSYWWPHQTRLSLSDDCQACRSIPACGRDAGRPLPSQLSPWQCHLVWNTTVGMLLQCMFIALLLWCLSDAVKQGYLQIKCLPVGSLSHRPSLQSAHCARNPHKNLSRSNVGRY